MEPMIKPALNKVAVTIFFVFIVNLLRPAKLICFTLECWTTTVWFLCENRPHTLRGWLRSDNKHHSVYAQRGGTDDQRLNHDRG